jgi:DNA-binding NarL/FixJ family response regulator
MHPNPDTVPPPPAGSHPARILLVDDHPILRDGLAQMIANTTDLTVCAEAANAAAALEAIQREQPDLAVVDVFLDGSNGIELTKTIGARWPTVKVLILSMHDELVYAQRAIQAGALGFVMKQEVSATILDAIRTVLSGRLHVSSAVAAALAVAPPPGQPNASRGDSVDALSDRELEIFELLGRGWSRGRIAAALQVSVKTIESHREHMKKKLRLEDANELTRRALFWVESQGRGG